MPRNRVAEYLRPAAPDVVPFLLWGIWISGDDVNTGRWIGSHLAADGRTFHVDRVSAEDHARELRRKGIGTITIVELLAGPA